MKLANGMGTVYKMTGRRRKPWRVMKTTGWTIDIKTGKTLQKRVTIGYYATREEAFSALMSYNKNPYDIEADTITFAQLYDKWSERHFETLSCDSSKRTIRSAFNHSRALHNMRFKDIKVAHLEGAIRACEMPSVQFRMKSLFNMLYRYALKHEVVTINYAQLCDGVKPMEPVREKKPFCDEEINILWQNASRTPCFEMILTGIYSGWRPKELLSLKTADIDLKAQTMRGGMKTSAGKNRVVPIHPYILPLVKKWCAKNNEYLFSNPDGTPITYDQYRLRFKHSLARFGIDHVPHETRHTFITLAKEYDMNEYVLKLIVGHNISDVTERIYTHRKIEQLHTEIRKIEANYKFATA